MQNLHRSKILKDACLFLLCVCRSTEKLGDEKYNKRLYSAQVKTGKKWLEYLPGDFNDELIPYLFNQMRDDDRVETAVENYYNNNRRLSAHDSS